ncbi:MAG: response regulator [Deferribacteraceae bacterium]|jgi:signal transduction histidine kinase/DNA-binding response OmpR family regulator|nr:response regulator [Deferribacteraceae bacterium]
MRSDLNVTRRNEKRSILTYTFLLLLVTTAAVFASLIFNIHNSKKSAYNNALFQARTIYDTDMYYWRLNLTLGGLYVETSDKARPNLYLPEGQRTVVTRSGTTLTYLNPTYMTRLVYELGVVNTELKRHITSEKPMREANKPDDWEALALSKIREGELEYSELITDPSGMQYLRYMGPLKIEERCIPCHTTQGYKYGEIAGGVATQISYEPYLLSINQTTQVLVVSHIAVWVILLIILLASTANLLGNLDRRYAAEDDVIKFNTDLERIVDDRTESLRVAKESAEGVNRAKTVFLNNISNEVSTPLSGVLESTEALLSTRLSSDQRARLAMIRKAGNNLMELMSDIMFFSKLESGAVSLSRDEINLSNFIYSAVGSVSHLAHEKNLDLIVDIDPEIPEFVFCDALRVAQVLMNLLSNAIKYTNSGNVLLSVSIQNKDTSTVALRFAVSDTGIGIPKENQERIFDVFELQAKDIASKSGGTGLGLAISKKLLFMMGSKINLDSEVGSGSRFWFDLYLAYSNRSITTDTTVKNEAQLTGLKALVVEDNNMSRNVICKLLAKWKVNTLEAANASEALRIIGETLAKSFDFIIMDMYMPNQSGLELAKNIKSNQYAKATPLILLTSGHLDCSYEERELFSSVLMKPVLPFDLMNAILRSNNLSAISKELKKQMFKELNVLLVDDSEQSRNELSGLLAELGHNTKIAVNGDEAVDTHKSEELDLIIIDTQSPVQGIGVAISKIKMEEEKAQKHVPIIAVTKISNVDDAGNFLPLGMDNYIVRPLDKEKLLDAIRVTLSADSASKGRIAEKRTLNKNFEALLVEDDELNQIVTQRHLSKLGYTVKVVASGSEALEACREKNFFIIFMVLRIPQHDGGLIIREIRKLGEKTKTYTPIIALTPVTSKTEQERYRELGMDGNLTKPVFMDSLKNVIELTVASVTSNDQTESVLDREFLKKNFLGVENIIPQTMEVFLNNVHSLVGELEKAVQTSNGKLLKNCAHSLNSSASYFSGTVRDLCLSLEQIGNEERFSASDANEILAKLKPAVLQLCNEIYEYLRTRNTI